MRNQTPVSESQVHTLPQNNIQHSQHFQIKSSLVGSFFVQKHIGVFDLPSNQSKIFSMHFHAENIQGDIETLRAVSD